MQDKQVFLDFLSGHGKENVLFEPFISRIHTETLIWRRGKHLWDTPEAYVNTLVELSRRTRADVIFGDMREYTVQEKERMLCAMETYPKSEGVGFAVICETQEDLTLAETCPAVCLVAVYGTAVSGKLPIIRMEGTLADAIVRGDAGWYADNCAEQALAEADGRIRILGGLGRTFILNGSPVGTYDGVERLAGKYPGQWACGSGFEIPAENYLELISLLGAFGRIR